MKNIRQTKWMCCLAVLGLAKALLYGDVPPPDDTATLYGKTIEMRVHSEGLPTAFPIVFIAEGFTEAEKESFLNKVNTFVDGIDQYSPFLEYNDHFSFYSIFVASNESGIDDYYSSQVVLKDTFFDGRRASGTNSLKVMNEPIGDECIDTFLTIRLNRQVVYIMNSTSGRANAFRGGSARLSMQYNVQTLVHELGHSIGRLSDEYVEHEAGVGVPLMGEARNVQEFSEAQISNGIQPEDVQWSDWLTPEIVLPTLRYPSSSNCYAPAIVGLYEGAYNGHNVFRPSCRCIMASSTTFCPVCREALAFHIIRSNVGVVNMSPMQTMVQAPGEETSIEFSIELDYPSTVNEIEYRWEVNGKRVVNNTPTLTLNRSPYGWLPVNVKLEVYLVETEDFDYIRDTDIYTNINNRVKFQEWRIQVPYWWVQGVYENPEEGYYPDVLNFHGPVPTYYTDLYDDSPVALGQLKYFAVVAWAHLVRPYRYGGTNDFSRPGAEISEMIDDFLEPQSKNNPANYSPITLGQLKAVAKPFYDRLHALGYDTKALLVLRGYPSTWPYIYPWDPSTPVSENYALATIGQLKLVFSFEYKP